MSKYQVCLTPEQRLALRSICSRGSHNARTIMRARVLLLINEGVSYKQICERESIGRTTPFDIARRFHERGLEGSIHDAPRPGRARVLDAGDEAQLIAIACSDPPDGYACWTISLMRDEVERKTHKAASNSTIARILMANNLKPWREKMWCVAEIAPEHEKRMMDVLEVHERPYDPQLPVVCFDEKSRQLLSHGRSGTPTAIGKPRRKDSEHTRHGTANLFVAVEPKAGFRHIEVTSHRKGEDVARALETLVMETCRDAKKVVLVLDDLNVHSRATIRKHLPKDRAQAVLARIEWHHTPKHASWLNMAEIEIGILSRQCLKRDMATRKEMENHVTIWQNHRNHNKARIDWKFTTKAATDKFKLDPAIQ